MQQLGKLPSLKFHFLCNFLIFIENKEWCLSVLQISCCFCNSCSVFIAFSAAGNSVNDSVGELPLKYLVHICNVCAFWIHSVWGGFSYRKVTLIMKLHNVGWGKGELLTWLKPTLSSKQLWGFVQDPSYKYCLNWRRVTLTIASPQVLVKSQTEKDINYRHICDEFLLTPSWKIPFGNNWKWISCQNLHPPYRVWTGNLPAIQTMARYVLCKILW